MLRPSRSCFDPTLRYGIYSEFSRPPDPAQEPGRSERAWGWLPARVRRQGRAKRLEISHEA
eukprot:2687436-Prymnesium_polylepis.2